jgi:hypothetical protein
MCDPETAILGAGAVGGLSSLIGGGISAQASTKAAQIQANAALQAAQLQQQAEQQALGFQEQQYATTQSNLAPYIGLGVGSVGNLAGAIPGLVSQTQNAVLPIAPISSALTGSAPSNLQLLSQTPGYQFTLQQGLQATQNSYAAQGLGSSGAALKGAANYAEGLAGTTYQQQFQNWLSQNQLLTSVQQAQNQQTQAQSGLRLQQPQTAFNLLASPVQTGAQASLGQGQIGTQLAQGLGQTAQTGATAIGQGITGAAAAGAAGTVGSANAISSALSGIGGAGSNTALLLALNQAGLFGGGVGSANQDFSGGLTG